MKSFQRFFGINQNKTPKKEETPKRKDNATPTPPKRKDTKKDQEISQNLLHEDSYDLVLKGDKDDEFKGSLPNLEKEYGNGAITKTNSTQDLDSTSESTTTPEKPKRLSLVESASSLGGSHSKLELESTISTSTTFTTAISYSSPKSTTSLFSQASFRLSPTRGSLTAKRMSEKLQGKVTKTCDLSDLLEDDIKSSAPDFQEFLESLKTNSSLKEFIFGIKSTDANNLVFAEVLESLKTTANLTTLDISGYQLNTETTQKLTECLKARTDSTNAKKITTLDVRDTHIKFEDLQQILRDNPSITKVEYPAVAEKNLDANEQNGYFTKSQVEQLDKLVNKNCVRELLAIKESSHIRDLKEEYGFEIDHDASMTALKSGKVDESLRSALANDPQISQGVKEFLVKSNEKLEGLNSLIKSVVNGSPDNTPRSTTAKPLDYKEVALASAISR